MNLRDEYELAIYDERFHPSIENLYGDARAVARLIEQFAPGCGVAVVVSWAFLCPGNQIYFRNLSGACAEYGYRKDILSRENLPSPVTAELPGKMLPMLASEAERAVPGLGAHITLRVAAAYNGYGPVIGTSVMYSVRNKWLAWRYEQGDVTIWELAVALRMHPRAIKFIFAGDIEPVSRQLSLF